MQPSTKLVLLVLLATPACARQRVVEVSVISADASAAEIALIGLEAGAPIQASSPAPDLPFRMGDRLTGTYTCNQGKTNLTLVIEQVDGTEVDAVFEFSFAGSPVLANGTREFDPAEGSFRMHGTYDAKTRALRLQRREWIEQPPRYSMVDLDGRFDRKGKYAGKVEGFGGCTTFEVTVDRP